jgi:hypothetical protein
MKGLTLGSITLGVAAIAVLAGLTQRKGVILINTPPSAAPTSQARCPDYSLEDDGVCLPLSVPRVGASGLDGNDWVSLEDLISSFDVAWRDAPIAPSRRDDLPRSTPVRLTRTRVGAPVSCGSALEDARIERVESTPDGAWFVAIAGVAANGETQRHVLTGFTAVAPALRAGAPCSPTTELGISGDVLVHYAARAAPPTEATATADSSTLPAAATASSSTASSGTVSSGTASSIAAPSPSVPVGSPTPSSTPQ